MYCSLKKQTAMQQNWKLCMLCLFISRQHTKNAYFPLSYYWWLRWIRRYKIFNFQYAIHWPNFWKKSYDEFM